MTPDPCPVALRGIVPSLATPFDAAGRVDPAAMERQVEHAVAAGCAGLLVLAVAGEQASLDAGEKDRLARAIVGRAAGRVPVIVSVTAPDPADSAALARLAREAGADGICVQAPAGLAGAALEAALARIAAAGPDLMMLQDLDWGGGGLALAEIERLCARLPTLKCLKIETVPAGPKYSAVLAATGGRLHVSGGWAVGQMMEALARGVHAFMPTGLEPAYVAIHAAWQAGRRAEARARFERLLPVLAFTNQHIHVSIRFWKAFRRAEGLFATDFCRAPVPPLDPFQAAEADALLARALALQAEAASHR